MRRSIPLFALVLIFAAFATSRVNAQVILRSTTADFGSLQRAGAAFPAIGGRRQLPNDTAQLLRLPQIRNELGLQDDQVDAIGNLSKAMSEQISAVFRNVDFTGADANRVMTEAQRAIREKTEEKLEELLTPPQLKRLKQIKVQSALNRQGAAAVMKGALGDAIRLSDKQKNQLQALHAKKQAELEKEIEALRRKYREETLKEVLTGSQLNDLKRLSGEDYEIQKPNYRAMFASPAKNSDGKKPNQSAPDKE